MQPQYKSFRTEFCFVVDPTSRSMMGRDERKNKEQEEENKRYNNKEEKGRGVLHKGTGYFMNEGSKEMNMAQSNKPIVWDF